MGGEEEEDERKAMFSLRKEEGSASACA